MSQSYYLSSIVGCADIFDRLLSSGDKDSNDLKVLRVFSGAVERKDFAGGKMNLDVFPLESTGAQCEEKYQKYSLHHIVRGNNPKILHMERKFEALHKEKKIPSSKECEEYRILVSHEEERVLNAVDVVLCTCNEAGSRRISQTLKPVYCIVDECAMATEPECMVPIRRANNVVLIGDHQQLQPVIQYREAENMGLGTSLFERCAEKMKIHVLKSQYRMVGY